MPNIGFSTTIKALLSYTLSTSEHSSVFNVKTGGASIRYWSYHHNIQYYQIIPTALLNIHVGSV